ncbi:hypothetical protein BH11PLA2_BH11PLA2_40710 [soil metagenome]
MLSRTILTLLIAALAVHAQAPPVAPPGLPPVTPPGAPPATPPVATPPVATPPAATPPVATPPVTPPVAAPVAPVAPPAAPAWPTQVGGKDLAAWLKEFTDSKDGSVREMAVKVIPMFGPTARAPALKPLIRRLGDETDPGVRANIILALGAIGSEKPEEAKQICEALHGILLKAGLGSPVRLHASRALAHYGPAAALAIPTFKNVAEDPAWETRQAVAQTLGRIGRATDPKKGPNSQAMNILIDRLMREESAVVRLEIAQSLLMLGPPAYRPDVQGDYEKVIKPFLDVIAKKLESETDDATRVWLLMVNMAYDGRAFNDTTITRIADYLNKPDVYAKYAALRALGLLGDKAKAAVNAMIGVLRSEDNSLVAEAIAALAAMKTLAKDALPELERIKAGTNDYLKTMATEAIDIISGKKNPAVMPK